MWVWVHGRGEGRLCLAIHPLCLTAQGHREAQGVEEARQTDKWTEPSTQDTRLKAPKSVTWPLCKKLGSDSVTESRTVELKISILKSCPDDSWERLHQEDQEEAAI